MAPPDAAASCRDVEHTLRRSHTHTHTRRLSAGATRTNRPLAGVCSTSPGVSMGTNGELFSFSVILTTRLAEVSNSVQKFEFRRSPKHTLRRLQRATRWPIRSQHLQDDTLKQSLAFGMFCFHVLNLKVDRRAHLFEIQAKHHYLIKLRWLTGFKTRHMLAPLIVSPVFDLPETDRLFPP